MMPMRFQVVDSLHHRQDEHHRNDGHGSEALEGEWHNRLF